MEDLLATISDARESATKQLGRIERGWRVELCVGTQTRMDITAETAEREQALIALMTRLIEDHGRKNG